MGTLAEVKDVVVGGNDEPDARCGDECQSTPCVAGSLCLCYSTGYFCKTFWSDKLMCLCVCVSKLHRIVTKDGIPTGVPRTNHKIVKWARQELLPC